MPDNTSSGKPFEIYPEPYAGVGFVLNIYGVFSNSLIIAATMKKDSDLRDKSNWLICILAIFDLLACLTVLYIPIELWLDWTFVTNKECFPVAFVNHMFLNAENFMILSVSVDRLLIISKPLEHSAWDLRKYVLAMVIPAALYSATVLVVGAVNLSNEVVVPICFPPTAMNGPAQPLFLFGGIVIAICITITNIACYCVSKNHPNSSSQALNRLRGSVTLVGVLYCLTTMTTFTIAAVVQSLKLSPTTTNTVLMYIGWLVFVNQSSNAVIYAVRSKHYRKAFKAVLHIENQVQPSNTAPRPRGR